MIDFNEVVTYVCILVCMYVVITVAKVVGNSVVSCRKLGFVIKLNGMRKPCLMIHTFTTAQYRTGRLWYTFEPKLHTKKGKK